LTHIISFGPNCTSQKERLRSLWRHYFSGTDALIFVVDSADRDRIGLAAAELRSIIQDPLMRNAVVLVYANKQDMPNALPPNEVCAQLGLSELRGRRWQVQGAVATRGEGLYDGLDWLSRELRSLPASAAS
jgi:Arf/Sar family protein